METIAEESCNVELGLCLWHSPDDITETITDTPSKFGCLIQSDQKLNSVRTIEPHDQAHRFTAEQR